MNRPVHRGKRPPRGSPPARPGPASPWARSSDWNLRSGPGASRVGSAVARAGNRARWQDRPPERCSRARKLFSPAHSTARSTSSRQPPRDQQHSASAALRRTPRRPPFTCAGFDSRVRQTGEVPMRFLIAMAAVVASVAASAAAEPILLRPAQVFDGVDPHPHAGWSVLVDGDKIAAVGPNVAAPPGAKILDLPGETLIPGMIEGHSHLFLHPYNETLWDDQVLHEPLALRTARAVVYADKTLMAGFTTERDLGTEGAGYADVGLKQAINHCIVPGPRLLVATKANVARGAYVPKGFEPGVHIPQGAEEISGADEMTRAARDQIAAGADVIKMYADYHYLPGEPSRPTMTEAEMAAGVAVAHDAGRLAAAHATTAEGMRRAILAGVDTVEHGYGGTPEVFKLMHDRGTALCPTLG